MFCDEVKVQFIAGKGGGGCVAFRREAYVPRGGPNGGDGGKGGSIYLVADDNINTLAEFNAQKIFRANPGEKGLGKEMGGADAPDLFLPVPVGTMIYDEKKKSLIADLKKQGDQFLVARGGKGGFGNAHFKSSTRQAPRFAELGEPGQDRSYMLELKLVADVGIIGLPSVGKSTLISRISNARPKIAEYHFTTLVPNLGVVTLKPFGGGVQQSFVACDLPGLIEGASQGRGLGIQFLKHVARNRVLVHLLDLNSLDPSEDFATIMKELKTFDKTLAKKPQIVAFNKIDTVDLTFAKSVVAAFKKKHRTLKKIFLMSCVTGEGIKDLVWEMWTELRRGVALSECDLQEEEAAKTKNEEEFKVFRPALEKLPQRFEIEVIKTGKAKRSFRVTGPRIEQIAVMTNFNNPEAVARVYNVFEKMHIVSALRRAGAQFGDRVIIGENALIYRWE